VKLVVQVKLLPSPEQAAALEATLRACNRAADHVSRTAFETGVKDRNGLQRLVYADIKATFGLSAQPAVRVVKKVVDAYGALAASLQAGRLGGPASKRYRKAVGSAVGFRAEAAQPFDDRCLSWQTDARTVPIWTVDGRMRGIRFAGSPDQLKTLAEYGKGESDLIKRGGTWFLIATCDLPDPEVYEPTGWIGVDRGIVNLATTSDGANYQGRRLNRYRRWQARKRAELQAKGTRSGTRRLARRSKREQRHATHVNHRISEEIVSVAMGAPPARAKPSVGEHRSRDRRRAARRDPGPGTASPRPAGHALLLAVPSARTALCLQGPPGRGAVCGGGSGVHLAALPALRAHRAGQPAHSGPFLLSSVRPRWAC
jgi:predicted transposase